MNQSGQIEPITDTEGPQMKSNNPLTNSHVNTKMDTWWAKNRIVPVLSLSNYQNACVSLHAWVKSNNSLSNSHINTSKGHSHKPRQKCRPFCSSLPARNNSDASECVPPRFGVVNPRPTHETSRTASLLTQPNGSKLEHVVGCGGNVRSVYLQNIWDHKE